MRAEARPPLVSSTGSSSTCAIPTWWCSTSARRIDGGGAEAYAKGHIPGAVHSDYDKAGWRVTRNGVPFMLPTLPELEKLIGELGIDEDSHVVVVPAGVHVHRFRRRGARLLDAEGRRRHRRCRSSMAALPPGRPTGQSDRDRHEQAVAEDLHGNARQGADRRRRARSSARAIGRRDTASMRDPRRSLPARRRRRRARPMAIFRARSISTARASTIAMTNRLKPKAELAAIAIGAAGRSGRQLLQHRPLGGDRLVRAVELLGRKDVQALLRLDGRVDRRCPPPGRFGAHQVGRPEEDARLRARKQRC